MRAPHEKHRRPRTSGRVPGTLGTLGGESLCQGFDIIISFQESQGYQLTHPRWRIPFGKILGDPITAGGEKLAICWHGD
jgi:hypothetical protein